MEKPTKAAPNKYERILKVDPQTAPEPSQTIADYLLEESYSTDEEELRRIVNNERSLRKGKGIECYELSRDRKGRQHFSRLI